MTSLPRSPLTLRFTNRRSLAVAALLGALVPGLAAPDVVAQTRPAAPTAPTAPEAAGEFPDAWYFYGPRRPAVLRGLEGRPAPALKLKSWVGDDEQVAAMETALANGSIEALRGKVVVVDFWATWCGPCRKAIPKNIEMVKELGKDGLVFIGVHDSKRGSARMPAMVESTKINYPVAVDDGGATAAAWKVPFWPMYSVIDRAGIVRAAGLSPDRVEAVVQKLLAEKAPAAKVAEPKKSAALPDTGADGAVALGAMGAAPQETKPDKPKVDRPFNRNPTERPPEGEFPHSYYFGTYRRSPKLMAMEGKPAPRLYADSWLGTPDETGTVTTRMKDGMLDLGLLKGRVVVVYFWSTVSDPCLRAMDKNRNLVNDFRPRGLEFIAVHDGELGTDLREAAVSAHQCNFPNGLDVGNKSKEAWNVEVYPTFAVIDHLGVVRAIGIRTSRVQEIVDMLIREKDEAEAKAAQQPFGVAPRPE